MMEIQSSSWRRFFDSEKKLGYFSELSQTIEGARIKKKTAVFPPAEFTFRAFELTPFSQVKVCIVGQDPYPKPGQAVGLSFGVSEETQIPRSLGEIFRRVERDGFKKPTGKTLVGWAEQGVLMLNRVLTVEEGAPGSHAELGWERFTNRVVEELSADSHPKVFLLWGSQAQQLAPLIDQKRHQILRASHPVARAKNNFRNVDTPMFAEANRWLEKWGRGGIDWSRS